tara:strand:+ start:212 stop:421 length:210 start_codon:yes stop_codon:yes gene_type:complete
MIENFRIARIEREGTDSWITYEFDQDMSIPDIYQFLHEYMPGWELVMASEDRDVEEIRYMNKWENDDEN